MRGETQTKQLLPLTVCPPYGGEDPCSSRNLDIRDQKQNKMQVWPMAVWPQKGKTVQGIARHLCFGAFSKQDEIIAHTLRPDLAVTEIEIYFPVPAHSFCVYGG